MSATVHKVTSIPTKNSKNEDLLQGPLGIWKYWRGFFQFTRNWVRLLRLSIAALPRKRDKVN
jgi:hypothetical protein